MSQQANTAITAPISLTGTFRSLAANATGTEPVAGKPPSSSGEKLPPARQAKAPEIEKIVQKLNTVSVSIGRDLKFQVNLGNGRTTIQVLNSETGEIIRQIPAEDATSYLQSEGNLAFRLVDEVA